MLRRTSWLVLFAAVLAYRDLRIHYKRASLGLAWAIAQPLVLVLVFTIVFGRFLRLDIPRYPLFLLSGVFAWRFFQTAVSHATVSYVRSAALVRRTSTPRALLPLAAVLSEAFHFAVSLLLLCVFAPLWGGEPGPHWLALVPAFVLSTAILCGIGLFLAPIQARFRDVRYVVEMGLVVLFYAVPIVYPADRIPEGAHAWLVWNPAALSILPFREILYEGAVPSAGTWLATAATAAALLGAGLGFNLSRAKNVADYV